MSKKQIEYFIPHAMKILIENFPDGKIPSAYNGYISSFGASIIQSGLLPTLAVFENENNKEKKKADDSVLTKLILKILVNGTKETSLLTYVLGKPNEEQYLKQNIIDIAIALKLCIRTFKLEE